MTVRLFLSALALTFIGSLSMAQALPPEPPEPPVHVVQTDLLKLAAGLGDEQRIDWGLDYDLGVDFKDGAWKKSFLVPVDVHPSVALYRGRLYVLDFFRKSNYQPSGSDLRDDADPKKTNQLAPSFLIGADGGLTFEKASGSKNLLGDLLSDGQPRIRLYRGSNKFQLAFYQTLNKIIASKKSSDVPSKPELGELEKVVATLKQDRDSKHYFPTWQKFLKKASEKKSTVRQLIVDSAQIFSGSQGGLFTTPHGPAASFFAFKNFNGGESLPNGAVLIFDLDTKALASLEKQLYLGIESFTTTYIEINFQGPDAQELLIRGLAKESWLVPHDK